LKPMRGVKKRGASKGVVVDVVVVRVAGDLRRGNKKSVPRGKVRLLARRGVVRLRLKRISAKEISAMRKRWMKKNENT